MWRIGSWESWRIYASCWRQQNPWAWNPRGETLHKIIGRAHCNPCPPASNVTDQEFIDEGVAAFRIVGAAVRISAAEGIQLLLGS